jgi:hypothetical protein
VGWRRRTRWTRETLDGWQHGAAPGLDLPRRTLANVITALLAVDPAGALGVFEVHRERQEPGGWTLYWCDLAGWGTAAWQIEEAEQVVVLYSLRWA